MQASIWWYFDGLEVESPQTLDLNVAAKRCGFRTAVRWCIWWLCFSLCACQEYERLAAQLDGAQSPLAEKVQNISSCNSKIPLVEAAERHAELLNALAMNLSRWDTNDLH